MVNEGRDCEWLDEEDVVEEVALVELAEEDSDSSDSSLLVRDETELDSLGSAYSDPLSSLALSLSAGSGSSLAIRLLVS